jgi:hypothetical protein
MPRVSALRRGEGWAWLGLLGGYAAWAAWFIYRTSFVVDGRRVFCLFDDAMISMTYARNLVEGHGLNWARQGAPVEGFTQPLWTALMVPVNALPMALEHRSLVVQVLAFVLLVLNLVLIRNLVRRHFTRPGARHWMPACVLTAFYLPLNHWALIGMESALQAVLLSALVLLALDIVHLRRDRQLALLVVATLAIFTRLDMALLVALVLVWLWAHGGLRWQHPAARRGWIAGGVLLVGSVAGYSLFRWLYFHDVLPNTYYLKLGQVPLAPRLLHGGAALLDTFRAHWVLLLAVAVGLAPQLSPRLSAYRETSWRGRLVLPAAAFLLCCAYSVYVGGDAWEEESAANRFIAFAMPMVFVLGNALANQALSAARRGERRRRRPSSHAGERPPRRHREPLGLRYALWIATVAALLSANSLWFYEDTADNWKRFLSVTRHLDADVYTEVLHRLRAMEKLADPTATVAVVWAGTPAYFSNFRLIDTLGYNDRKLARMKPVHAFDEDAFDNFVPGHVKWDFGYLFDERHPDAVLQLWDDDEEEPALVEHGYLQVGDVWVDPNSPLIHLPAERSTALPLAAALPR